MATEPLQGIYIPDNTLAPLGGSQIAQSVTEAVRKVVQKYANAAARDAAFTAAGLTAAQKAGMVVVLEDTDLYYGTDDGVNWYVIGGKMQRLWQEKRASTGSVTMGTFTGLFDPALALPSSAPAGDYLITAYCGLSNTVSSSGQLRVLAGTANLTDDIGFHTNNEVKWASFCGGYQHVGGALTINVQYTAPAGTVSIWQGSRVVASWLGPR